MQNNDEVLEDHYIAYIDILGYEKQLQSADNQYSFYKQIERAFKDAMKIAGQHEFSGIREVNYRIFSDNIVLSIPIAKQNSFAAICQFSWAIQCSFIMNGFLVRGGISSGLFLQNNEFVFGKGLINAYKLESQNSIYPRIVIDRKLLENFPYHYHQIMLMNQDFDGYYFIHYLKHPGNQNVVIRDGESLHLQNTDLFKKHKEIIENGIQKEKDTRIIQKLLWCANYHNSCEEVQNTKHLISDNISKQKIKLKLPT